MKSNLWLIVVTAFLIGCEKEPEEWICYFPEQNGQKHLRVDFSNQTLLLDAVGVPIKENGDTVFWNVWGSYGSFSRETGKLFGAGEHLANCSKQH